MRNGKWAKRMSLTKFDFAKLLALLGLIAFSFYSGLQKFVFVAPSFKPLTLSPDYSVCDNVKTCVPCKDKISLELLCRADVAAIFRTASQKCSGYINNYNKCRSAQSHRQSQCKIEYGNIESCVTSVTKNTLQEWSDPSSKQIDF
jgi:hypothetical protein